MIRGDALISVRRENILTIIIKLILFAKFQYLIIKFLKI